eukprot:814255-Rhodomonas_salina.1
MGVSSGFARPHRHGTGLSTGAPGTLLASLRARYAISGTEFGYAAIRRALGTSQCAQYCLPGIERPDAVPDSGTDRRAGTGGEGRSEQARGAGPLSGSVPPYSRAPARSGVVSRQRRVLRGRRSAAILKRTMENNPEKSAADAVSQSGFQQLYEIDHGALPTCCVCQ